MCPGIILEKPQVRVAKNDIFRVIAENPGIRNNDIARKLGYVFDLGDRGRGWFVYNIVDELVENGKVVRPIPRTTKCYLTEHYKKLKKKTPAFAGKA